MGAEQEERYFNSTAIMHSSSSAPGTAGASAGYARGMSSLAGYAGS